MCSNFSYVKTLVQGFFFRTSHLTRTPTHIRFNRCLLLSLLKPIITFIKIQITLSATKDLRNISKQ